MGLCRPTVRAFLHWQIDLKGLDSGNFHRQEALLVWSELSTRLSDVSMPSVWVPLSLTDTQSLSGRVLPYALNVYQRVEITLIMSRCQPYESPVRSCNLLRKGSPVHIVVRIGSRWLIHRLAAQIMSKTARSAVARSCFIWTWMRMVS